jgi:monoamine oxidase
MSDTQQDLDVAIVGAGLAGLGGRTLTRTLGRDDVDLGAQWIGPTQDHVAALVREFGLATFPQYTRGRKVLAIGGRVSTYRGTIPSLPLLSLADLQLAITRLERLARRVPLDRPALARRAGDWDALTVADWQRGALRSADARTVLDGAVRAIFAAEPAELSFLFFLFYLRSGGGLMRLAEVKNGAQQDRIAGGTQQLALRLAEQPGVRVQLAAPVHAIAQDEAGVTVRTDAGEVRARYAIVAAPPALAGTIDYTPALPADRADLHGRMPMGSAIKCVLAYRRPFWRDAGFSGEILSDTGAIRLAFDDSPHDASQGALVVFLLGDSARTWSERTPAERARAICGELARYLGPQAAHPIAYADQDWTREAWSRGCYTGIMAPGVMTAVGHALREPAGRIHWAGTETAQRWAGYMDGAIESGERAAAEVAARLRRGN